MFCKLRLLLLYIPWKRAAYFCVLASASFENLPSWISSQLQLVLYVTDSWVLRIIFLIENILAETDFFLVVKCKPHSFFCVEFSYGKIHCVSICEVYEMPIFSTCKVYPLSLICSHMVKIYISQKKHPVSISLEIAVSNIQQH